MAVSERGPVCVLTQEFRDLQDSLKQAMQVQCGAVAFPASPQQKPDSGLRL